MCKAQRIQPVLYSGGALVEKHDANYLPDIEETLKLAEDSRLKMNAKQNDQIVKEKKVYITPIDYASLNKLYEYFIPQKQLSTEQAFWLPISKTISKKPLVQPEPVENDLPRELPSITMHSYADLVDKYDDMEKSFIDEYNKCLELEAELSKKKDMVEKDVYNELSNKFSTLEKHCISLKIVVQQSKESFQNDRPCNNQDAPEFHESFEINELKAWLQVKNTTLGNLKKHIANLKGKSVSDCTEPINNSNVLAPGMFKLDLQPLFPKLRKNREVHVDYLKQTKEHVDTLHAIVENARALKPLDNALDYACKFTTRIQKFHDLCVVDYLNVVNVRAKSKSVKSVTKNEWKLTDLKYLHVFGALCYPTNDSEDLGKLKPKADIGIFIGYSPAKKAYRIYNKWTRLIMEMIHVKFDELTAMAFEQFGSRPAPQLLTTGFISSGLMQNPSSSTPYVTQNESVL
ncbi:hypothetical protein Tco_0613547 [Tanacetum coccineum]